MRVSTCSSKGSTPAPWIFTENDVTSSRRILTASLPTVTLFASVWRRNQRNRFNRIIKSSAKGAEHVSFQNSWDSVDMPIKQSETPANHHIWLQTFWRIAKSSIKFGWVTYLWRHHLCWSILFPFSGKALLPSARQTIFLHPFEQHVRKSLQSEPATHWNIWHMIKRKIWQRRPWTVEQQEWKKPFSSRWSPQFPNTCRAVKKKRTHVARWERSPTFLKWFARSIY